MKPTEDFQKTLYDEMLGRIKETDLSVPYRDGGWFYYSRTEKGQQYPIYCRKKGSVEAPEEIYLDVNALAKGEKFMSVGARSVSDGGNLLAYTTDNTGFRDYTLHVKDLATGKLFPETVARASSVAWAADNKTLFYTVTDMAKRPYRLYRHTLGADPSTDVLLYEEKDEMFRVFTGRSRSRAVIFVGLGSLTSNEWYWIPADEPDGKLRLISAREKDHEYDVDHRGDLFYIRTNKGCRNYRVVTAPMADPGQANWKEMTPCRDDVMIEDVSLFADYGVFSEREDGLPRLRVMDFASGASYRLDFPEAIYDAYITNNCRVRHQGAALRLPVLHDAADRVRLRHGDPCAQAPEADRGPRRLRPVALRLGAALRDGRRRHEGPDLGRLPQGLRRRRQGPAAPDGLRLLRRAVGRGIQLEPRQPARPRRRLRRRPHPRRRRPRQEVARPGADDVEEEHLHRLHRRGRGPRRRQVHVEGPPRDRGRLAPAACSWAP